MRTWEDFEREVRAIAWSNKWADGGPGEAEELAAEFAARMRRLGAALRKLMPRGRETS